MGRRLGQHFLADPRIAAGIAAAVDPGADEALLEIGGGTGALTRHLVGRCRRLVVVELDPRLAERLRARYGDEVEVLEADIREVDLAGLGEASWAVVGNLPYYITSDILVWLCAAHPLVDRALIMMQAEVADRLLAPAGSGAYGRLSVLVQYHAAVEPVMKVGQGAFQPPPKVGSAVVRLRFREHPPVEVADEARFFALVEHGFRWRRKTLLNILGRWLEADREILQTRLEAAGIEPQRRAETLDLADFARLEAALADLPARE